MVDYTKSCAIIPSFDWFVNQLSEELKSKIISDFNRQSGALIPYFESDEWAKYKHYLKFDFLDIKVIEVYDRRNGFQLHKTELIITGSFHKNHFKGFNHQDFKFSHVQYQLDLIEKTFGVELEKYKICNIEIGVNFIVDFLIRQTLKQKLLAFRKRQFKEYDEDSKGRIIGSYNKFVDNFIMKLYDKGILFFNNPKLMRYEYKFLRMQKLKTFGIYTLADLRDNEKLIKTIEFIVKCFEDIIYSEYLREGVALNPEEQKYFDKVSNSKFWEDLALESNTKYQNEVKKFKSFKSKYCECQQLELSNQIKTKFFELLET